MNDRLRCPSCGKSVVFDGIESGPMMCPACGTQFAPPPPPIDPEPAAGDWAASDPRPARRAASAKGRAFQVALVGGIGLLMIGGVIVVALRGSRQPAALASHSSTPAAPASFDEAAVVDEVLPIKTDAEVLALSGKFASAMAKYRQIDTLLAGHEPKDPLLKNLAGQVGDSERRIQGLLDAQADAAAPASLSLPRPPAESPAPPDPAVVAKDQGSDFEPATAVASQPVGTQPVATAPAAESPAGSPAATEPALPARQVVTPDRPNPSLPSTLAPSRGISDEQIGLAIERGVGFVLSQFHDDQVSPEEDLADPQKQALDALCVYALLQSSRAIDEPRLKIAGPLMPDLIEKLKSYDLSSDGQVVNRPITYGRSMRAAALATYNRPDDDKALKDDVAWLVGAEVQGGYTYDDLYEQLIKEGLRPTPNGQAPRLAPAPRGRRADAAPANLGPVRDLGVVTPLDQMSCADGGGGFGGGSPAPVGGGGDPVPYGPSGGGVPIGGPTGVIGGGSGGGGSIPGGVPFTIGVGRGPTFDRGYMYRPARPGPLWTRGPAAGSKGAGGGMGIPNSPNYPPYKPDRKAVTTFEFPWDNSNSQYGLLGVWAGAEVGMEIPDAFWRDVEQHWLSCQFRDGQWGYNKQAQAGTFAMTCAGVASLLVTHDYLDAPLNKGAVGRPPYSPALHAGIAWLDNANNSINIPGPATHYAGYDLFGIERVGLASGYKYFGDHDWFRELAAKIVPNQFPNGAWGREDHGVDAVVDTCFTLLYLSRGRHPVVMTKLKFEPAWDNRPRDVANLARFAGRELERQLNWQVVGIQHEWYDWFDSPVLYIASHERPKFGEAEYRKLRNFVMAGGLLFTHADGNAEAFNRWVPELAKQIAPNHELKPLADNDPLFSIQYKLNGNHPRLLGVSNGVRLLLVHSPADLALAWQQRSDKTKRVDFQLGTNVFLYAAGKPDLRNRVDSPFIPPPPAAARRTIPLARVKYAGNWDPEPAAWFRFARYLQWETGDALELSPVPIEDLAQGTQRVAALTGVEAHAFTDAEQASLRKFVESGGLLLVDACGGENAFTHGVRDNLLHKAFAGTAPEALAPDHPLFKDLKAGLANTSPLRLRPFAIERLGQLAPQVELYKVGKGYLVFSALDLTSGLLGTNTWGIVGYQPASCEKFVRNLIEWHVPQDMTRS